MSVIHAPGMAFDTSTGKIRLVGKMTSTFDVTLDVSGLALGDALVRDMTDDQRAAVLAAFLAKDGGISGIVEAACQRGQYSTNATPDYVLSDQDIDPDCDHWRTVCDVCKYRCRLCDQDQDSDDALRAHVATHDDLDPAYNCRHCGVPGGH